MMWIQDASAILEELSDNLDISPEVRESAIAEYTRVAEWLGAEVSELREDAMVIFPQGSFRLGTVVHPLRDSHEIDVDLVCRLALGKEETTQEDLKNRVGERLREHQEYRRILREGRRCWILDYPGQFHLDVLPSIPDRDRKNRSILLTDRELRYWQHSHPIGYAEWFKEQMLDALMESRRIVAKAQTIDIEDVPEWETKTPLQRVVQLLKRHRDLYFKGDPDLCPISIIITTLAARSYDQETDLYNAMRNVVARMPSHIERRDGRWWVPNPVSQAENFADKWNENPAKATAFQNWLAQVARIVDPNVLAKSTSIQAERQLRESFQGTASELAAGASNQRVTVTGSNVPALGSTAHAERTKWPESLSYKSSVRGEVYPRYSGSRLWQMSERPVPKNVRLRFELKTNVPRPYDVFWQVVNTGEEAARAQQLRGEFYPSEGPQGVRWEPTAYAGSHWVEAFVVKDGVCVSRAKKTVRVRS